jgi:hypothetical protein
MRQQANESSGLLAALMLALLGVGIITLLMSVQALPTFGLSDLRALTRQAIPVRPTDGATPPERAARVALKDTAPGAPAEPSASVAAPAESVSQPADAAPLLPAFVVGQRARIAHTDGQGVVLHASPSQDARRPAGLLEGTSVTVLELSGSEWARVQSDSKQAGWISTAYLDQQ